MCGKSERGCVTTALFFSVCVCVCVCVWYHLSSLSDMLDTKISGQNDNTPLKCLNADSEGHLLQNWWMYLHLQYVFFEL